MAAPTAPRAARIVGSLVAEIETEIDGLVARTGERIREEIPEFRRVPVDALARAIRGNVLRALTALRDLRPPTDAELEQAAEIGRERAEQGLTVDAVLHAYRISISSVWSRFGEVARERGADVASVLAFSETLWLWADAVMDIVAHAHREVELEQAREEQQRRDAFVVALLTGTLSAAELRRESATHGLDADRDYVPFRARSASHRAAAALAGDGGLVITLDRDLAGIALRAPHAMEGVACGIGPPARLADVAASLRSPAARSRPRSRSGRRARTRSRTSRSARRSSPTSRSATRSPPATSSRSTRSAGWAPSSTRRCAPGSTRRCASTRPRACCTCTRTRSAIGCAASRR